jgi:hypothetical protein
MIKKKQIKKHFSYVGACGGMTKMLFYLLFLPYFQSNGNNNLLIRDRNNK